MNETESNAKAALVELIINTDMHIDDVEVMWVNSFCGKIDSERLAEIWVEVLDSLPELN